MMVHEILSGMFGAAHLRQQIRYQMKDFEKNLQVLKKIVERLSRDGPFICRIITVSKFYAGRLEKLELVSDSRLRFIIRGCHADGSSNGTAGVFSKTVNLIDVLDIQVAADKNGQPVFWSNLFPDLSDDNGNLK